MSWYNKWNSDSLLVTHIPLVMVRDVWEIFSKSLGCCFAAKKRTNLPVSAHGVISLWLSHSSEFCSVKCQKCLCVGGKDYYWIVVLGGGFSCWWWLHSQPKKILNIIVFVVVWWGFLLFMRDFFPVRLFPWYISASKQNISYYMSLGESDNLRDGSRHTQATLRASAAWPIGVLQRGATLQFQVCSWTSQCTPCKAMPCLCKPQLRLESEVSTGIEIIRAREPTGRWR